MQQLQQELPAVSTADHIYMEDGQGGPIKSYGIGGNLVSYITDCFRMFQNARIPFEEIWRECLYNYLGQYQPELVWRKKSEGKDHFSRIFIKLTTLKCNTAHSKIVDAMFTGKPDMPFDLLPYGMRGMQIPPDLLNDVKHEAKEYLKEYFRQIELEEILDDSILEGCVFGSIILKAPIVIAQRVPKIRMRTMAGIPANKMGKNLSPFYVEYEEELVAVVDSVPIWEYYVDPNAKSPAESIGEIHFKRVLPADFLAFAYTPGYDREAVWEASRRATLTHEADLRYIQLGDQFTGEQGVKDERISVLEWWGKVKVELLRQEGVEVPEKIHNEEWLEAVVVIAADGVLIKAELNPFSRRPFYVCPIKKRPRTVFGIGYAESMRDSQKIVNSAARLFIDNKALSGNGMVAINLDKIDRKMTRNIEVYPRKVWYLKGNATPKDAIGSVTFQDVSSGLREMIEFGERWSDEETGLPKYTSGEQSNFLNKTASGMSMLMSAANINLKTVMRNIDNFLIEPIVEMFHEFLSETDPDYTMGIPLRVKATGTDSLVARELKLEQMMKFMQVTANPQDAIFIDRPKQIRQIAGLLEQEDVMRSKEEIDAIMKEMANRANAPTDLREFISIDKIYPLLTRMEQMQILQQLGIEPDPNVQPLPTQVPGAGIGNPEVKALPGPGPGAGEKGA